MYTVYELYIRFIVLFLLLYFALKWQQLSKIHFFSVLPNVFFSHLIDDADLRGELAAPLESYKERGLSWRRKCGVRLTHWMSRHILKGLLKEMARTMRRTVMVKSQAPLARLQGLWQMSFTNTHSNHKWYLKSKRGSWHATLVYFLCRTGS